MVMPPSITIISGTPGTGKTTVSSALGEIWSREGADPLHLVSDTFFSFPVTVISPEKPEAHKQNVTVSKAVTAAARSFAEGGYHVILDGVIGLRMLPHYLAGLQGFDMPIAYVVLRASLDETLRRARRRQDADKFNEEGVSYMHRQFADLKVFEPHVMETEGRTVQQSVTDVAAALAAGRYRISMSG